jgi:hypothetical protein
LTDLPTGCAGAQIGLEVFRLPLQSAKQQSGRQPDDCSDPSLSTLANDAHGQTLRRVSRFVVLVGTVA